MAHQTFTLNFMGDTMLGRLIDQMFPEHVNEPEEARIANSFKKSNAQLSNYGPLSPWGNTLPLLQAADLNLLNLETSATTHLKKWPDKVFNYRMHPDNIRALQTAKVSYCSLANNHTLDFSEPGLLETVQTIKKAGIAFAGAGETEDEARRPAVLYLNSKDGTSMYEVHVWSASDHPRDWATVPTFHFLDYTQQTRNRLKSLLTAPSKADLKVFSVHWGPNYAWEPANEIQDLAHFLIDECGIDIVHGHSSHHVQGVEKYKNKLIIYGCGDFVDDYALVPEYRNDLSAIWRVTVEELSEDASAKGLKLNSLTIRPTKIERFQARALEQAEVDFHWVNDRVTRLGKVLGTTIDVPGTNGGYAMLSLTANNAQLPPFD